MQVVNIEDTRLRALEKPGSMSCEAQLARAVRALVASPDGRWAALVLPHAVHVFDIAATKYHGQLPLPQVAPACFLGSYHIGSHSQLPKHRWLLVFKA